jgi:4-carboxymuconolactone decarboxylase
VIRVRPLAKEEVCDEDILRAFELQEKTYGSVLDNHAILARRPAIFRGFRKMWDVLDEGSLLGARLVFLVNIRLSSLIGCSLCIGANSFLGRAAGISEDELLALRQPVLHGGFNEREQTALEYADAIAASHVVSDELFARVRSRFSEDEIVQLTATITWEICVAKFNRALNVDGA